MRILRAIVHPEPLLMTAGQMEIVEGSTVGAQLVGDYQPGCEALLLSSLRMSLRAARLSRRR
jgi:hypothetical protein